MKDDFSMEELLKRYPPGKQIVSEKKKAEKTRPPQSGPGRKTLAKMETQITLDVHGMVSREAEKAVEEFIRSCGKRGYRRALIIHGKGKHSEGKAVLKPLVRRILDQHPQVADFGTAAKNEGGQGATWLVLTISRGK